MSADWATRLDVIAHVHGYAAALDDKRYQDAGDCFSDDGALVLGEHVIRSPSVIAKQIGSDLNRYSMTQHLISNALVTLSKGADGGELAHFRGEVIGTHSWTEDDTPRQSMVGGRYDVDLRREPNGWRLVTLAPTYLWTLGDPLAH